MLTIGFIGLAGAGKDTACNYMVDVFSGFGLPTNRTSFAMPLKTIAKRCFGEGYDDRDNKEVLVPFGVEKVHEAVDMCVVYYKEWLIANEVQSIDYLVDSFRKCARALISAHAVDNKMMLSPRILQQIVGTDLFRKQAGENFWVEFVKSRLPKDKVNFLSDVRFANEISVCDTLVILNRDGIEPVAHHVSEKLASDLICSKAPVQALRKQYGYQGSIHVVSNNGQLWQLRDKVAKLSILIKDEAMAAEKLPLDLPFTLES